MKCKKKINCPHCDAVYILSYDTDENEEDPLFCSFCGEEVPEGIKRVDLK